jgi:hypothetical protein
MWAAWVVAAIALAATTFMLRFLIALLREGAPTVCYWILPVRELEKERHLQVLSGIHVDEDCSAPEDKGRDYYVELLENENYAQEESDSSPIALDVPHVSDRLGWRAVHPRHGSSFREDRL